MKPSTTEPGDKKILQMVCDGVCRSALRNVIIGNELIGYSLPKTHSLSEVWLLRLQFQDDSVYELSSIPTHTAGWNETGVIKIKNIGPEIWKKDIASGLFARFNVRFLTKRVQVLAYENNDYKVESGLFLRDKFNDVSIVAGTPPGSLSVKALFSNDPFRPEYPWHLYDFMDITDETTTPAEGDRRSDG